MVYIFVVRTQYSTVKYDITHFCYSFDSASIPLHQIRPFCSTKHIRTHYTLSICTAPHPMDMHHTRISESNKNDRQSIM